MFGFIALFAFRTVFNYDEFVFCFRILYTLYVLFFSLVFYVYGMDLRLFIGLDLFFNW
jgi:hypothetical protein